MRSRHKFCKILEILSAQINVWYLAEKRQKSTHFSLTPNALLLDLEGLFSEWKKFKVKKYEIKIRMVQTKYFIICIRFCSQKLVFNLGIP